jgi:hypothetical protein
MVSTSEQAQSVTLVGMAPACVGRIWFLHSCKWVGKMVPSFVRVGSERYGSFIHSGELGKMGKMVPSFVRMGWERYGSFIHSDGLGKCPPQLQRPLKQRGKSCWTLYWFVHIRTAALELLPSMCLLPLGLEPFERIVCSAS